MTEHLDQHAPIVIVGGGPTGVTAATLLARYHVETLIIDRWADVYPQPRAVHLDDEIYRILARLGVAEEFATISRPARGLRLLDNDLRVLAEFSRETTLSRNGFPSANMFDQPDLEALLRKNLKRHPLARFRGDAEVLDVTFDDGGPIRLTVLDRASGRQSSITADVVLGCDGANSIVRRAIGSTMQNLKFDQRWLVVDVATDADLHQWEGAHQVCDIHRAATFMRIGKDRYRWEFQLLARETADDFNNLTALGPLIRPWTGNVADRDLRLVRVAEYTFRAQIADRWRRGNVFLLGDAAHLTPPFIGQGMGAGLRDAMNLAWKLAGVLAGTLPETVLDTYQQERKPHAQQMIQLALNIGRAMTAGGKLGAAARRVLIPRLHLLPGLRSKIVDSETPALHTSALTHRTVHASRIAGTLCPNPLMPSGVRLDQELGDGFALIHRVPLTPAQQRVLDSRGSHACFAAPGSALAHWLHRRRVTGAIIRPDRSVMRAGRRLTQLCWAIPTFKPENSPAPRVSSEK